MLTDKQKAELHAHDAGTRKTTTAEQIKRIHMAVNDGTLDRDTVNDALERLTELTGDHAGQKHQDSFGNGPQGNARPVTTSPQVTGQPDPQPNPNFPNGRPADPNYPNGRPGVDANHPNG